MSLFSYLVVAAGGAVGAVLRALVHRGLTSWHGAASAWSTLGVNVAGSFALGVAAGGLADRTSPLAQFLMLGLLGAFTTFSTFAMDAVFLARDRGIVMASLYVGLSVAVSIGAFVAGYSLGRTAAT